MQDMLLHFFFLFFSFLSDADAYPITENKTITRINDPKIYPKMRYLCMPFFYYSYVLLLLFSFGVKFVY